MKPSKVYMLKWCANVSKELCCEVSIVLEERFREHYDKYNQKIDVEWLMFIVAGMIYYLGIDISEASGLHYTEAIREIAEAAIDLGNAKVKREENEQK